MKIILFTHPSFLSSQSMPRYANMIEQGMVNKGHNVDIWTAKARFYKLPFKGSFKKWLGYVDQYVLFPLEVLFKLKNVAKNTLFVFADQALGPWVSLVCDKPHVVHCHDFLALKSALGTVPENPTSSTGKIYQNFIRKGFSKGKYFISISNKSKQDLHVYHKGEIELSEVCYNGLNRHLEQLDEVVSRSILGNQLQLDLSKGYILHVGGNQYYKNRKGVIEIYSAWRSTSELNLPLILIGTSPSPELDKVYQNSSFKKDIHFVIGLSDDFINMAYSGASCLLFPSIDEGFGWPIAEALASGCLVITTDAPPMTEVVGKAGFLIPRRPSNLELVNDWALKGAIQISKILELSDTKRLLWLNLGLDQVRKFNTKSSLDKIEQFYQLVLNSKK